MQEAPSLLSGYPFFFRLELLLLQKLEPNVSADKSILVQVTNKGSLGFAGLSLSSVFGCSVSVLNIEFVLRLCLHDLVKEIESRLVKFSSKNGSGAKTLKISLAYLLVCSIAAASALTQ